MASIAAYGVFNAIAFAGYLFKLLDGKGYQKEIKHHDLAMEKLTQAREEWYQNEVLKNDEISRKRQELIALRADMRTVDKALDELRKMTIHNRTFTRLPQLNDYYRPSEEMDHYKHLVVGSAGLASGLLLGSVLYNLSFRNLRSRSLWVTKFKYLQ